MPKESHLSSAIAVCGVFAVLVLVVLAALLVSLNVRHSILASNYPTVHFILPSGFNGPFVVAAPSDEQERRQYAGGEYEIRVPEDGVVIVDDDSIFRTWHYTILSTTDGVIVREKVDRSPKVIKGGTVFLSKGSSEDSIARENWFYYGARGGDTNIAALDRLDGAVQARFMNRQSSDETGLNKADK